MIPEIKEYKRPMGKMQDWSTDDFLNELMFHYGAKTNYALHKLLKVTRPTIYRYREGNGTFDDAIAMRVGELLQAKGLKVDPAFMLVWVAGQRARTEQAREWWEKILARWKAASPMVIAAIAVYFALPLLDAWRLSDAAAASTLYIMLNAVAAIWLAIELLIIVYAFDDPPLSGFPDRRAPRDSLPSHAPQ